MSVRVLKVLVLAGVCATVSAAARGAIVQTNSQSTASEIAFPVSSTDLVNNGQSTLGGLSASGFSAFSDGSGSSSPNILNDGTAGTSQKSVETAVTTQTTNWTLTINLNTSTNTQGYSLSEIDSYSGWTVDYVNQKYTLAYSTVSAPTSFTNVLGTFENDSTTTTGTSPPSSLKIALTDSTGQIATNVAALQFTFQPDSVRAHQGAYREIDVIGTATPEPASASLVLLAGTALLLRRRQPARI